jgi:hypothetical protein
MPVNNVEWHARRWLHSVPPARLARLLAWIPLLMTPPLLAVAVVIYVHRRDGPVALDRDNRITIAIAIANLTLSLAFFYVAREQLYELAGAFAELLGRLLSSGVSWPILREA